MFRNLVGAAFGIGMGTFLWGACRPPQTPPAPLARALTAPAERPGRVEYVSPTVTRHDRDITDGVGAGAIIGGLLIFGGGGAASLLGAAAGAAIGAPAAQTIPDTRTYQVLVHFDDGTYGRFVYEDESPFIAGERVVWTPDGLRAAPEPQRSARAAHRRGTLPVSR